VVSCSLILPVDKPLPVFIQVAVHLQGRGSVGMQPQAVQGVRQLDKDQSALEADGHWYPEDMAFAKEWH
jgi:hypothetical protein